MRKKHLERISLLNHFIQVGFFSSIFTFTSNVGGIRIILERGLHAILFPIAITPDAIASLLALFSFHKAKNKNFGKTFDLIYVPTKAALVFTAVFAGLSVTIVHSLFLTVVSSGFIYHTGLGLYNAYHWWKTPETPASHLKLKNLYKNNMINNGISSLIGAIVLTGIITTLIFAPLLSAPILAIAGIGTAVMLMLTTSYTVYRYFKQATTSPLPPYTSLPNFSTNIAESTMPVIKGYYYRKFRSEALSGNFNEDKKFLLDEIENKKHELKNQPKNPRRKAKLIFLENITELLSNFHLKPDNSKFILDIDQLLSTAPREVFQSFFRAKGDMEDIVHAIKVFVNRYKYAPLKEEVTEGIHLSSLVHSPLLNNYSLSSGE